MIAAVSAQGALRFAIIDGTWVRRSTLSPVLDLPRRSGGTSRPQEPHMPEPRIPLPEDADLDAADLAFLRTVPPYNVWRMIARTGIAPQFAVPLSAMFDPSWFPELDREIILFRTCFANGSTYEIPQHRAFDIVPGPTVDAILADDLAELDEWPRKLCRLTDEMAREARLTSASVAELVRHYGSENQACKAMLIMSWFNMLSRFVDSTGVPIESPEWLRANAASPTGFRDGGTPPAS
jgi:alkylhydroperoxidase family enzyme